MTTSAKGKSSVVSIEALFHEDRDLFKRLLKESLQEVLEAEMTEALAAGPVSEARSGWVIGPATTAAASSQGLKKALREMLPDAC